jgi:threonine/homoserine/homoserine lactone efflux protein
VGLGEAVASFAVVAAVLTITPGLDTALVLRAALTRGRRHAAATALGVCTGVLVWATAAAVGLSALLTASTTAYDALRWAGVAYMTWLGARLLWHALRGERRDLTHGAAVERTPWASYRAGLLTNLLNPKVGAFYVAVLPQFVPDGMSSAAVGALLGVVHNLEGLVWFALLIAAADRARRVFASPRVQAGVEALTGIVLIGVAVRLARSHAE